MADPMIIIENLGVTVRNKQRENKSILQGVNLTLTKNTVLGLVGESGSGKTMTMRALLGLLPGEAIISADTWKLNGVAYPVGRRLPIKMAMVFQDPLTGLNPVRTVGYHLEEVIKRTHPEYSRVKRQALAIMALEKVEIAKPQNRLGQYPHELSGGLRQRVLIAMALLAEPDLLIADEPTTALDVTVQAQILGLIKRLQQTEHLTVIFISHDLSVVSAIADEVVVMREGRVVEFGDVNKIFTNPTDAYTQRLVSLVSGERGRIK